MRNNHHRIERFALHHVIEERLAHHAIGKARTQLHTANAQVSVGRRMLGAVAVERQADGGERWQGGGIEFRHGKRAHE